MTRQVTDESRVQLTRVARGGALNLAGAVISAVSGFALVAVVANYFDQATAGSLFASTAAFMVVIALVTFGADTGIVHFVLKLEERGRSGDIPLVLDSARRPVAVFSTLVGVAAFAAAGPIADALGLVDAGSTAAVRVLAIALPLTAWSHLAQSETIALGRMRPTVFVDLIFRSGAQTLAVLAVGLAAGGLVMLTVGWVAPYVVATVFSVPIARRLMRRRSARWAAEPHSTPREARREFWRYSAPRGVAKMSQVVIQRVDVVLIAAMLGLVEAAVYAAATRFVTVGQMGVRAIQMVLSPRFTQLVARRDFDTVSDVFQISTAWSMLLMWPFYAIVASAASLYLEIFGDDYRSSDSVFVVVVMAVGMMLATAGGPLDTLLLMSGRSIASLINGVTAAAVNVALCVALIPLWGIRGAALAWALAVLVRNGMAYAQVHKDLHVTPFNETGGLVAAASIGCYVLPLATISLIGELTVWSFAVAVVAGSVAYLLIAWKARRALELTVFRSAIRGRRGSV
jgi:O-antigen/teichoic acid export membrane protein